MAQLGLQPRAPAARNSGFSLLNASLLPQATSWALRPQFLTGNPSAKDYQVPIAAASDLVPSSMWVPAVDAFASASVGPRTPPARGTQPSPAPLPAGSSPPDYPGKQLHCSSSPSHTATPSGTSLLNHQIPCLPSERRVTFVRAENIHAGRGGNSTPTSQALTGTPSHSPADQIRFLQPRAEWDGWRQCVLLHGIGFTSIGVLVP